MRLARELTFYTSLTSRLFNAHFEFLSSKFVLRKRHKKLTDQLKTAQSDFLKSLDRLLTNSSLQNYLEWQAMGSDSLIPKTFKVSAFDSGDLGLIKTFLALDHFLIPLFVARTKSLLTSADFKLLQTEVKVLFDVMVVVFAEQTFEGGNKSKARFSGN